MGWFLVIVGCFGLAGGTQIKSTNNEWAAVAVVAVWCAACVAVIALGVAVEHGWLSR